MSDETPLHRPQNTDTSATFRFRDLVNAKYGLSLRTYHDLWLWSTSHVSDFWSGRLGSGNPPWFPEARVNWAENMLHCRSTEKVALIQATEPTPVNPTPDLRQCTYAELYDLVSRLVSSLLANGLKPGDRVASYSSNCIENVALCLATTCFLERFEQVQPKFIFAVDALIYNAKVHDHLAKLTALLSGLAAESLNPAKEDRSAWKDGWVSWEDFLLEGDAKKLGRAHGEILWHRASFNWPLWILVSIVHRAGGMLLQAKKEFVICADLKPEDVFFYYTTTGWMMYNFLISGLSLGCTLLFLWKLTDDLKISIFGTSAKYIEQLSKGYKPRYQHNLSSLRHIYSTGSPLSAELFKWTYENIHPDILLGSITGGTDICSLFAGMCSALPVYAGEIQCRMLGLAVESYSETGTLNAPDEPGELVAAAAAKYKRAYFAEIEGVWYHGDHIVITRSRAGNGGGVVMLGRSDGVLNPGGIRFGSSELYDVIDSAFSATGKIVDCLAVGQTIGGSDEQVILFVKLPDSEELSPALVRQIKEEVRARRTARHVPAQKVEVLVKKIVNGASLSIVNPATLANPECLEFYHNIGIELRKNA
ncbi:acetoacetyl-CoA synthetase [Mycena olivaceomarginata]|nr:acetoacetyl-CoA synthetase [Mycena olivaceomarginata]